ncbi:MAG: hypothetical protein E3K37_13460 [Candidatus Kuenenia sp.]|nr:hypothetical protein [Candidatus Kuenenia hertensis]
MISGVIRYLYNAPEIQVERVIDTIKEISEEGGKLSMTIAAKLIEKGRLEGEKKGRIEGLKEAIGIGLELKYGVTGLKLLEKMSNITSMEKLEAIKEAVRISKNIQEIDKVIVAVKDLSLKCVRKQYCPDKYLRSHNFLYVL